MRKESQHASRKLEAGAGMLSWDSHAKALMTKRLLEYCDATRGAWKDVLDHWIGGRFEEGRGVIFSTTPLKTLVSSTTGMESQLPKFWRRALEAVRELGMDLATPRSMGRDSARGLPMWSNPLFSLPKLKTMRVWRDVLELRTVKDTMKEDGSAYSDADMTEYITTRLHTEGNNVRVSRGVWTNVPRLLKEWHCLIDKVPEYVSNAAKGIATETRYSTVAQQMMRSMGWTPGQGLGPHGQGRATIVEPEEGTKDREGLGFRKSRKAVKPKHADIKAAIVGDLPCYVQCHSDTFELLEVTSKGKTKPTGRLIAVHPSELRDILWWNGGIIGPAERAFPHPEDWRLGSICKPINQVEVRDLTYCFTEKLVKLPNCLAKWDTIVEGIHWRTFLARYKPGFATPKDFGSHFKLILHRAFFTNPHNPSAASDRCRCCGWERESIAHLGKCLMLKPIFEFTRV